MPSIASSSALTALSIVSLSRRPHRSEALRSRYHSAARGSVVAAVRTIRTIFRSARARARVMASENSAKGLSPARPRSIHPKYVDDATPTLCAAISG